MRMLRKLANSSSARPPVIAHSSRQALLYLPPHLPDPTQDTFPARAAARMAELCAITGGRALLLFTSFRNMRIAEAPPARGAPPFPLLVQGERPRHLLLASMRERTRFGVAGDAELLGGRRRPR